VHSNPLRGASALAVLVAVAVVACASPYERGERLYRQGDLRGALEVWRGEPPGADPRIPERLLEVEGEFERLLRRYEKRAESFEAEGRLAEAVLFYRLALKLDPNWPVLLHRVQELVRVQQEEVRAKREELSVALAEGRLREASELVSQLGHLDPFDPAIQIDVRQVRAAVGAEVQRYLEVGKEAYAAGNRAGARRSFLAALKLDDQNETALGYLSYLRRFEESEQQPGRSSPPPPPETISQEEILAEGHFHAAEQAEGAGEPYRAIAEYQAALRINENHERARRRLERVRDGLRPQIADLYAIGKRYFQDEDLHNAVRVWRQLLMIDPGHERTRENVERAERMLSRLEEIQSSGR
jgi:tetratricopeptide (TPR) repeat protein